MKSVYLTWKWKYDSGFDFWLENTSKEYERKRSNEEYSTKKKEKEKRTASHPTTSASVKGDELHKQCAVMNFKFNTSNSFTWNVPPHSVLSIYLKCWFLFWCLILLLFFVCPCLLCLPASFAVKVDYNESNPHEKPANLFLNLTSFQIRICEAVENICSDAQLDIHKKLISVCHNCECSDNIL